MNILLRKLFAVLVWYINLISLNKKNVKRTNTKSYDSVFRVPYLQRFTHIRSAWNLFNIIYEETLNILSLDNS